jgi:hypothetical protein
MLHLSILDFISLFPLGFAFYLLWKERKHFSSLTPLIIGVVFVFLARFADLVIEHPTIRVSDWLRLPREEFDIIINTVGNLADVLGVLFLVIGFIRTIKFGKEEEKKIHNLEKLLPICATCKKYRTDDSVWMPIEKYLIDSGSPPLTHGICPDCAAKFREEMKIKNK